MANISVTKLKFNELSALSAAVDASGGAKIPFKGCDDSRMLIILENESASAVTATVKAGDSIQGVNDLELSVEGSATSVITVESGKYMMTSGEDAGYVTVTGAVKAAAVLLP